MGWFRNCNHVLDSFWVCCAVATSINYPELGNLQDSLGMKYKAPDQGLHSRWTSKALRAGLGSGLREIPSLRSCVPSQEESSLVRKCIAAKGCASNGGKRAAHHVSARRKGRVCRRTAPHCWSPWSSCASHCWFCITLACFFSLAGHSGSAALSVMTVVGYRAPYSLHPCWPLNSHCFFFFLISVQSILSHIYILLPHFICSLLSHI